MLKKYSRVTSIRAATCEELGELIARHKAMVDLIVIDTGPGAGEPLKKALSEADFALVPVMKNPDAQAGADAVVRVVHGRCAVVGNQVSRWDNDVKCDARVEDLGRDPLSVLAAGAEFPSSWWMSDDLCDCVPDSVRVVAVAAQKGGVGKSTIAWLLARQAANRGASVIVVDFDTQEGSVTRTRKYEPRTRL